eukprot:SAG11_NODE_1257_length_5369_cov_4.408159_2_plen_735_part_00
MMDSPSTNPHARFGLARAEPWQQEAAQRQIEAQRAQRAALDAQIAEKQARDGGGQRRTQQHHQHQHQHEGPPLERNWSGPTPGGGAEESIYVAAPPVPQAYCAPAEEHAPPMNRRGHDERVNDRQARPPYDDYENQPPMNRRGGGNGGGGGGGGYDGHGALPMQQRGEPGGHGDDHYNENRQPPPKDWGETSSSFGGGGARQPPVPPLSVASNSPHGRGGPVADIDSAGYSEILGMMQELKAQNAEMRAQLDQTIKANHEVQLSTRRGKSAPTGVPRHGRRASRERARRNCGKDEPAAPSAAPANRHRRAPEPALSKPRPRVDVQEDMEILLAYYAEYDKPKATEEKVATIIETFRAKYGGGWRDEMYSRIGEKRGVNPRDLFRDRRKQEQRNPLGITLLRQSDSDRQQAGPSRLDPNLGGAARQRPPALQLPGAGPRPCGDSAIPEPQPQRNFGGEHCEEGYGPPPSDGHDHGHRGDHAPSSYGRERELAAAPPPAQGGGGSRGSGPVMQVVPGLEGISALVNSGPQPRRAPTPRTLAARTRGRGGGVANAGREASAWHEAAAADRSDQGYPPAVHRGPPPLRQQSVPTCQQEPPQLPLQGDYEQPHDQRYESQQQRQYEPEPPQSHSRSVPLEPRPYAMYQDDTPSPVATAVNSPTETHAPTHSRFALRNMAPEEQAEQQRKIERQAVMRAEWDNQLRSKVEEQQVHGGGGAHGGGGDASHPHHRIVPPRRW